MKTKLITIINEYKKSEGTSTQSAIRDCITDLLHICKEENISFEECLGGAWEVFEQEN